MPGRSWALGSNGRPGASRRAVAAMVLATIMCGCTAQDSDRAGGWSTDRPTSLSRKPFDRAVTRDESIERRYLSDRRGSDTSPLIFRHSGSPLEPASFGDLELSSENVINLAGRSLTLAQLLDLVLSEILRVNYVVDAVLPEKARVALRTDLTASGALEILQNVLELNGLALNERSGVFYVVAQPEKGTIQFGPSDQLWLFRVNFISADDFRRLATTFVPEAKLMTVDNDPSLVLFAGSSDGFNSVEELRDLLDIFDLRNTRVEFAFLEEAFPDDVIFQVQRVLGGPNDTLMPRLIPFDGANAVIIVSPLEFDTTDVKLLIDRLDHGAPFLAPPVFTYRPRHRSAEQILIIATGLVSPPERPSRRSAPPSNPTMELPEAGPPPGLNSDPKIVPAESKQQEAPSQAVSMPASPPMNDMMAGLASATGLTGIGQQQHQLANRATTLQRLLENVALDKVNNNILFYGTEGRFRLLSQILEEIDAPRKQILIEAVILEVRLNELLRYGVQYALDSGGEVDVLGRLSRTLTLAGTISTGFPGLILDITSGDLRSVIDVFEDITETRIISSPKIIVATGETATLQFGEMVPTLQAQTQEINDLNNLIQSNSVEYVETGVNLTVTPMNIDDRVADIRLVESISSVVADSLGEIESPVIDERRIETRARVGFGETILLGGIIQTNEEEGEGGVPLLKDIPLVGALFSQTRKEHIRSELVLLLRPTLHSDESVAQASTDVLRRRFERAYEIVKSRNLLGDGAAERAAPRAGTESSEAQEQARGYEEVAQ